MSGEIGISVVPFQNDSSKKKTSSEEADTIPQEVDPDFVPEVPTIEKMESELYEIRIKWRTLGKEVGIPDDELDAFNKQWTDPVKLLAKVLEFWKCGKGTIPFSWASVVGILKSGSMLEWEKAENLQKFLVSGKLIRRKFRKSQLPVEVDNANPTKTNTGSQTDSKFPPKEPKKIRFLTDWDEPRDDPTFPYLANDDDMNRQFLRAKLADDTSKMRSCFATLVFNLQKCVERANVPPEYVIDVIATSDANFRPHLQSCDTISQLFYKACDFWSFFDHAMIRLLAETFGDREVMRRLDRYTELYNDYARRLVAECPIDAFGIETRPKDTVVIFKIERSIRRLRVYQMKNISNSINEIFSNINFHLTRVVRGCVQLTFKVLPDSVKGGLNLTEEQKQALRDLGVLSLQYGDEKYDLRPSGNEDHEGESEEKKDGEGSSSGNTAESADGDEGTKPNDKMEVGDNVGDTATTAETEGMETEATQVVETSPAELLEKAIKTGDLEKVKELIKGGINIVVRTPMNDTAMHVAASYGKLEILKYLLEEEKLSATVLSVDGASPLTCAIETKHLPVVQYLVEQHQLDPLSVDKDSYTPIHKACNCGSLEMVQYLMDKAQENTALKEIFIFFTEFRMTPLDVAAMQGNLDIIKYYVLELGCDPNMTTKTNSRGAIYQACNLGYTEIVKYFLDEAKCDPMVKDDNNITLLHLAATQGYLELVQYLSCVKKCDPYARDSKSNTPFHNAASNGHTEVFRFFITELNCDPNFPSNGGRTALHMAAQAGHYQIVKFLLEQCACNPALTDNDLVTPLHLAAKGGHLPIVHYLTLDSGCDVMTQTSDTSTPLHWAAYEGQLEVVKFFVEVLHCPPTIRGRRNQTPLEHALEKGQDLVADYLRSVSP